MKTPAPRLDARHASLAAVLLAAASLLLPCTASAYGWPVKPFHRQHPVRGFLGDPRIDDRNHTGSLHFGVDVVAADGTPVYATLSGRVSIHPLHRDTVMVSDGRSPVFEYWHVIPAVPTGTWAEAYRTVIGHVEAPWAHVHFSERSGSLYLNPLRPGALEPYADGTRPETGPLTAESHGRSVRIGRLHGTVDLVSEVRDRMPVAAPAPWTGKPVMPALVRWRLAGHRGTTAWQTAYDVRAALPSCDFGDVYAVWTRQNKPWRVGRYRLYLTRGLDTTRLADGAYRVEVEATDTAGNRGRGVTAIVVRNAPSGAVSRGR